MLNGFLSLTRALALFRQHPKLLLLLLLAPWTINLILFLGGWSALTIWMTGLVEPYLAELVDGWWQSLLVGLGNFVAVVVAGGVAFLITIIGSVVVAAPFHDRLSATVERCVRPGAMAPAQLGWIKSLKEGGKTALLLLAVEVALLPLLLIAGIGHVVFAILSAWVLTLGLLDIPLARKGLLLRQKHRFVRKNFAGVLGLSLGVLLVAPIPFLNLLTIPLVVMAATLLVTDADGVAT